MTHPSFEPPPFEAGPEPKLSKQHARRKLLTRRKIEQYHEEKRRREAHE